MKFDYLNRDDNVIGNYPIAHLNSWHGGIHAVGEIKVIADGEIVAYKISSKYQEERKTVESQEKLSYYSDSFILVKHAYSYTIKEQGVEEEKIFIFYSLYVHLQTKDDLILEKQYPHFLNWDQKIKGKEKLKTTMTVKSGINMRLAPGKDVLGIIPKDCVIVVYPESPKEHWYKVMSSKLLKEVRTSDKVLIEVVSTRNDGYYFDKKITSEYTICKKEGLNSPLPFFQQPLSKNNSSQVYFLEKRKYTCVELPGEYRETINTVNRSEEDKIKLEKSGAILLENSSSNSKVIGIIPNDDEKLVIQILEKKSDEWYKVRAPYIFVLIENTATKIIYEKQIQKDGFIGWCKNIDGQFDSYLKLEYDKVVELEKPIKVFAGEIIGYSGKYQLLTSNGMSNYGAAHIEVFSKDDVPAFMEDMKKCISPKNQIFEIKEIKNEFKTETFTYLKRIEVIEEAKTKKDDSKGDRINPDKLKLSDKGKAFIRAWEGEKLEGYLDSKGYLTIGVGNLLYDKNTGEKIELRNSSEINSAETIKRVDSEFISADSKGVKKVKITQEKSDMLFDDHAKLFEDEVIKLNFDFYQWEFDAMVSLFFNTGSNIEAPSLRKHLKNGNYTDAGKQFNDITGGDDKGLVYRRAAEMDIFLNGGETEYVYFENNDKTRRDKLVGKLNDIRKELKIKQYKE